MSLLYSAQCPRVLYYHIAAELPRPPPAGGPAKPRNEEAGRRQGGRQGGREGTVQGHWDQFLRQGEGLEGGAGAAGALNLVFYSSSFSAPERERRWERETKRTSASASACQSGSCQSHRRCGNGAFHLNCGARCGLCVTSDRQATLRTQMPRVRPRPTR